MRTFLVVVLGVAAVGCTRTFSGEAVQPNPLAHPTETLRVSEPVTIVRGDMDLETPDPANGFVASPAHNRRYPLKNQASFTIISRDRLRFHVQVDHKWQEWADLRTWKVHLEDDAGHRWEPESIEHAHTKIITRMWDREVRTSVCDGMGVNGAGDCYHNIGYQDDGYKNRQTLGNISVFRGKADFVFYQRDLFSANVRRLRLVVARPGEAFEFNWRFQDTYASN